MEQSQRRAGSAKRRPSGLRIKGLIIVAAALVAVGDRLLFLDSHPEQDPQAVPVTFECSSPEKPGVHCNPSNVSLQSEGPAIADAQGHTISGHVASADGDALGGVTIVARPDRLDDKEIQQDSNLRFRTKTDSLGAYSFSGLPAGEYTIRSDKLGQYYPARVSTRTGIDYANLVMSPNRDLVVEGRVFGEFGEPLEGVIVSPGLLGQPSGQTGLDGGFALPLSVSPTVASLTLRFHVPGYREQSTTVLVAAQSSDGPEELEVAMDPIQSWTSVEGRVVDDSGAPLADRRVELRSQAGRQQQSTTTDKSGRYAFAFVECPADYRLLVSGGDGFRDAEERLHVTPNMKDVVVVAEASEAGTVARQLVNRRSAPIAEFELVQRHVDSRNSPAAGSRMILNWSDQASQVNAQATRGAAADSQGQFTFINIRPGPTLLAVEAQGLLGDDIAHDFAAMGTTWP